MLRAAVKWIIILEMRCEVDYKTLFVLGTAWSDRFRKGMS